MSNTPEPLVDVDSVARRLGTSKWVVWDLVRRGDLPAVRLGRRRYKFDMRVVEQWITSGGAACDEPEGSS